MVDDPLNSAQQRMLHSLETFRQDLASIRTGRAHPSIVEHLSVEYYNTIVPLQQIAGISSPEPRLILIEPWDKGAVRDIEKSIQKSDLGLNPQIDGTAIRIPIPTLTEERRRDLAKTLRGRLEEKRIEIRNIRRDTVDDLRKKERGKEISADDSRKAQEQVQKLTDQHVSEAEKIGKAKEVEIMEV